MKPGTRSIAASVLVSLLGISFLWWSTDGFSAFTAETARRLEVLRSPRALPTTLLEDQDGQLFRLQDYQGRLVAVEFIYTRCTTLCRSMGMAFRQIRDRVPAQILQHDFALLSISFDPERDDLSSLKAYGKTYDADGKHWRIARVRNAADLKPLLKAFGVVAIPDGLGGFEHNAAIQLIGRNSKLIQIVDIDNPLQFADRIATWL